MVRALFGEMRKAITCILFLLVFVMPVFPGAQAAPPKKKQRRQRTSTSLIGNIIKTNMYEGCGCRFQLRSEHRAQSHRYCFVGDQGQRAWMNIDGKDVELRLVGASEMSLKTVKGEKAYFRFRGPGINVRLRMLVTRTSTYETDYEPQRYAIILQVARGSRRQTLRPFGWCAC
jgi:hypothetical protein